MKTFTTIWITVCLLSLLLIPTKALTFQRRFRSAKIESEIPTEIKNATNISDLQPFLENKNESIRMAAVRRLGEIDESNKIDLLQDVFSFQKLQLDEQEKKPRSFFPLP